MHPAESEEGRAFLQQRLALFSKISFLLSAFFWVGGIGIDFAAHPNAFGAAIGAPSLWHLVGIAVALGAWLLTRSPRRPLGHGALVAVDVGLIVFSLAAYAAMAGGAPGSSTRMHGAELVAARMDLLMLLITLLVLTLRAVLVPSTMRHTLLVSIPGAMPAMALAPWLLHRYHVGEPVFTPAMGAAHAFLWSTAAVIASALTSRVIYGLRAQVAAAQRLGQYMLDEKIGEGGMGMVYRASHALLRRPTAIKLLPPERAGLESLSRFEREVQLTARLTHPNTVAIFDYGHTPQGVFYYAMEYLEGIDLEELVEWDGPQPPARVVHVLQQVCGSLAEAHGIGLVHRDVKPANVILCERGGVADVAKVVDFGLVKDIRSAADGNVTRNEAVIGTPLYLSPEAIKNPDTIDARADIYAVGAVGYFLLAGAPPFDGDSVVEICAKHLHEKPPPLSGRAPQPVPPPLETLLLRCLEKNPAGRPESAVALREALLALGLPWTEKEARAWWEARGSDRSARGVARRADTPGAVTVDVVARRPRGVPPAA